MRAESALDIQSLTMAVGRALVQPPIAVKLNGLIVAINPCTIVMKTATKEIQTDF